MSRKPFNFVNLLFMRKKYSEQNIRFGRFSGRNKTKEQLFAWQESEKYFEKNEYLIGMVNFLEFLKVEGFENIQYKTKKKRIEFSFFQGSKKIYGFVTKDEIYAYSDLTKFNRNNEMLYKLLLELNYNLKFAKFSINDDIIKIELNQSILKNTPESIYFSMRELALVADRYDDYLEENFEAVEIINRPNIINLEPKELGIKVKYFHKILNDTFIQLANVEASKFAGARSFVLMNAVYKILYLITPEGILLEKLKSIYEYYFADNNKTEIEKSSFVFSRLKALNNLSSEELEKSLYNVSYTFPEVLPSEPDEVLEFLKKEIRKIYWYESNEHKAVALAILEYIIGYTNFSFGIFPIMNELFIIFWQIMNREYFKELGIKETLFEKDKISYFFLAQKISKINSSAANIFPKFYFNSKHLNLDNYFEFAKSFVHELINIDFTQA